jgi:hypothetical protein
VPHDRLRSVESFEPNRLPSPEATVAEGPRVGCDCRLLGSALTVCGLNVEFDRANAIDGQQVEREWYEWMTSVG